MGAALAAENEINEMIKGARRIIVGRWMAFFEESLVDYESRGGINRVE